MEQEQETEPTPTPKIILKTGANVNVTFSSDEEGPGGLSSIQEEESSEAPKPPTQSQPTQSQPTPLKFSMPIPKQEEEPVAMDFESALGMLKKNKELKKGRFQRNSRIVFTVENEMVCMSRESDCKFDIDKRPKRRLNKIKMKKSKLNLKTNMKL